MSFSRWFTSFKCYLVALNRRPKMGPDAYEAGLMEPYWMRFADLNFRPRATLGAFVLLRILPALGVALGVVYFAAFGGAISALVTAWVSFWVFWGIRMSFRKLPPVPTRRARLEVRQNDLRMEMDLVETFREEINARAAAGVLGRLFANGFFRAELFRSETAEARLMRLRQELEWVENELAAHYADWREFLDERAERSR